MALENTPTPIEGEQHWHERRIQELLDEQRLIFENAQVGILLLRNRIILKCNQFIADMVGLSGPDALIGKTTEILYRSHAAYEATGKIGYAQLAEKAYARFETELWNHAENKPRWAILSGRALDANAPLEAPSIWVYTDITVRRQADLALEQSRQLFSDAFDSCPIAATISDTETGRYIEVNANFERDFGWSRAETIGLSSIEIGLWPTPETRQAWRDAMDHAGRLVNYETVWVNKNGELRNVSLSSQITEIDGKSCILAYISDITTRKHAEADLRIAASAFEAQEGMVVTDARGVILRINRAFTESTGYVPEEIIGKTPSILKSGLHDDEFYRDMWRSLLATGSWQGELWDRRRNGEIYPKWLTIAAVRNEAGAITHFIGAHHDITERKKAEEKIKDLAFYDQLTSLPNRTLLLDRLKQIIASNTRSGSHSALLFIDLDNFKTLNDTRGHDVGDLLLQQVASRLKLSVRQEDTVARLGGDEFVLVFPALGQDEAESATRVEVIAEKIIDTLGKPYDLGSTQHQCTASMGATLFRGGEATIDELMKQADLAMYKAKEAGRNRIRFFDPGLEAAVKKRAAIEDDLRNAIDAGQLQLFYQPQVVNAKSITGLEALVRWQHPAKGMIAPADFIPIAEETGLILAIGDWVLATACRQLAIWADQPAFEQLSIAVNVSARQFHQDDFIDKVRGSLAATGANPQRLKLELTESMLAENVDDIIAKMTDLKACGVGFSLDDFGTGYSSLAYLKRLPLDQLKIDQSFVRDVLTDHNAKVIARAIIALAKSLGLAVIAEGVETEEQRSFLHESDCDAYQGYLFSRPVPVEEFELFARQRSSF